MDIEERNQKSKAYSYFRVSLDFGMGSLYTVIGVMVICFHTFGTVEISPVVAYVFGGLMVAYGLFRLYRGVKDLFNA